MGHLARTLAIVRDERIKLHYSGKLLFRGILFHFMHFIFFFSQANDFERLISYKKFKKLPKSIIES